MNIRFWFLVGSMASAALLFPSRPARSQDLERLRQSAEKGDAQAQFELAWAYADGKGVKKDEAKAFELFKQAAAQGHAKAQHNVAVRYLIGQGTKKNPTAAFEWEKKAAETGIAPAEDNLGWMYLRGIGTERDCQEAVDWFRRAAKQNYVDAQVRLLVADMGREKGCAKNYDEAAFWAKKAAAAGNGNAQNMLGYLYEYGLGVQRDPGKALKWFRKGALQGNAKAQANLGALYAGGTAALPRDLVQAYFWLKLSALQGEGMGEAPLREVRKDMSPVQIAEGDRRVSEYQATGSGKVRRRTRNQAQHPESPDPGYQWVTGTAPRKDLLR
jgi:uncharacterized protein